MITKNIGYNFSKEELQGETSRMCNGVTITIYKGDEPIQEIDPSQELEDKRKALIEQILLRDKTFCQNLINQFLIDNRDLQTPFSTTTSVNLLQKFQSIKGLSEVGDVKNVKRILENTDIDSIFTQNRKDKYILMCSNYLGL